MRIVIAEDAVLLREGLATLLRTAGHDVVASVGDGEELLDAVRRHNPDLSIVDVRMPPTHTDEGIQAAQTLRRENPDTRLLVLSQIVSGRAAADLLASGNGGIGYLLKDRIGNVAFTGVDGVFPDYRRILMAGSALPEMMAGVLDCNPDYARDALKAIKLVERTTYATLAKVSGGRWCWSTARMQIVVQNLRALEKYGPMHKLDAFL